MVGEQRVVVAGVIVDAEHRVLACRRTRPAHLAGKWEFPGGKAEPGEDGPAALRRELREELGIAVQVGSLIRPGPGHEHDTDWPINQAQVMRAYWCQAEHKPTTSTDHDHLRWCSADQLGELDWLPADVALAALVASSLPTSGCATMEP